MNYTDPFAFRISREEAADILRVKPETLTVHHSLKTPKWPPSSNYGGAAYYDLRQVLAHVRWKLTPTIREAMTCDEAMEACLKPENRHLWAGEEAA